MKRVICLSLALVFAPLGMSAAPSPGDEILLSDTAPRESSFVLTAGARSTFAVAWADTSSTLRLRFFRAHGAPLGDSIAFDLPEHAALASDGRTYALVYATATTVEGIRFDEAGVRLDEQPVVLASGVYPGGGVEVEAEGPGIFRVFWGANGTIWTRAFGTQLTQPIPLLTSSELEGIEAERHSGSDTWLVAITRKPECRLCACVEVLATTVYLADLENAPTLLGEFSVPFAMRVLRDGTIVVAEQHRAAAWTLVDEKATGLWAVQYAECPTSVVEHGARALLISLCDQLSVRALDESGSVVSTSIVDATGRDVSVFTTLRGSGFAYVSVPSNPRVVGRLMPSLLRRGIPRF